MGAGSRGLCDGASPLPQRSAGYASHRLREWWGAPIGGAAGNAHHLLHRLVAPPLVAASVRGGNV